MSRLHSRAGSTHPKRRASAGRTAAAAAAALALAACGGSSPSHTSSAATGPRPAKAGTATTATTVGRVSYEGPTLQNPATAPPISLNDYLGRRIDTASYRGKAILLTFIYTHCPDVCPLIVSNLHNALAELGPDASRVKIIAVSTDPKGDTRAAVTAFLAARQMTGRMEYLVGRRAELTPVWRAWGISASNPTAHDEVNHSALVYGITASGKVTVVYPANFSAKEIAHDVPLLAAQ
jgi:protein SCO1/2